VQGKFVAYYRVSTPKQGIQGLGMDAQRLAVQSFLNGGQLIAEFSEVESGRRNNRIQLQKALAFCRQEKAKLLIAKLDRLSRNAAFLLNLLESGVDFTAVDLPQADRFLTGIMAMVAEKERDMTSARTRAALAAAKRRGLRLGNPNYAAALSVALATRKRASEAFAREFEPIVAEIRRAGMTSLREIAFCLNARGYRTPRGKEFKAQSVKDLLTRIKAS
jgi:DNA invertase Pin-like site-specific DNA recombinase